MTPMNEKIVTSGDGIPKTAGPIVVNLKNIKHVYHDYEFSKSPLSKSVEKSKKKLRYLQTPKKKK
jgi:hypothetical protein